MSLYFAILPPLTAKTVSKFLLQKQNFSILYDYLP